MRGRLADADVYYGWVVVGSCFVAALAVFGTSYTFGVFFDRMLASFGGTRANLSLVFGVQTLVLYVGAAAVGGAVKRHGVRRSLAAGAVLLGVGLVGTSRSDTFLELVASYGVVSALGLSLVYVVGYATVPRWFGRRRGFANGVATSGLGVGLVVVAPAASALIAAFGWRTAYLVLAAGLVAALLAAAAVLADDPADVGADTSGEFPGGRGAAGPDVSDEAAAPDGDGHGDEDRSEVAGEGRNEGEGGVEAAARAGRARDPASVMRSLPFLLVLLGWTCVFASLYVVMGHLVLYVTDAGMARRVGVLAISAVGASTSVARLGVGYLSDRLGRVRIFATCGALMGALLLCLPAATTPALVWGFAALFGVGYGGTGALLSPLAADLFGEHNLERLYGVLSLAFAASGLVAPYLAGLGYEAFGGYDLVFAATGAAGLVGAAGIVVAGRMVGDGDGAGVGG